MTLKFLPVLLASLVLCFTGGLAAQDAKKAPAKKDGDHGDLGTAATNPVGSLIQIQLQDLYIPNSRNSEGYANTGIIQPVIPIALPAGGYFPGIVTRTTVPIVTTPEVNGNRETGIGDTTAIAAFTHTDSLGGKEFFTWGPMAATIVPTADKRETGSGVLSLGPGGVVLRNYANIFNDGDSLMVGGLGYHTWSVTNGRNNVSKTWGFPVLVYHFKELIGQKGWYLRYVDDLWSYDWNEEEWDVIPVGAYLGKVFSIGKQPVNVSAGGYYNAAGSDRAATADFAFKLSFTLLFP